MHLYLLYITLLIYAQVQKFYQFIHFLFILIKAN